MVRLFVLFFIKKLRPKSRDIPFCNASNPLIAALPAAKTDGAGDRVRTDDNWYHKPALYQLSYTRHKLLCPDLFGLALVF